MFKTKLTFSRKEILWSMLKERFGVIGGEEGNFVAFSLGSIGQLSFPFKAVL